MGIVQSTVEEGLSRMDLTMLLKLSLNNSIFPISSMTNTGFEQSTFCKIILKNMFIYIYSRCKYTCKFDVLFLPFYSKLALLGFQMPEAVRYTVQHYRSFWSQYCLPAFIINYNLNLRSAYIKNRHK